MEYVIGDSNRGRRSPLIACGEEKLEHRNIVRVYEASARWRDIRECRFEPFSVQGGDSSAALRTFLTGFVAEQPRLPRWGVDLPPVIPPAKNFVEYWDESRRRFASHGHEARNGAQGKQNRSEERRVGKEC